MMDATDGRNSNEKDGSARKNVKHKKRKNALDDNMQQ